MKKKFLLSKILVIILTGLVISLFLIHDPVSNKANALKGESWDDAYTIGTPEELAQFTLDAVTDDFAGKHIRIINDIDMTDYLTSGAGYAAWGGDGWLPVRKGSYFKGKFDGENHTVSGIWLSRESGAFFGSLDGAEIKNLRLVLDDKGITGTNSNLTAAGLTTTLYRNCLISNCSVKGKITGGDLVGGIAGYSSSGNVIDNCTVHAEITASKRGGGIAGGSDGTISNSRVFGTVNCLNAGGGIAGSSNGIITGCYSSAIVAGTSSIGGIAGESEGTIEKCYSSGEITGTSNVGGLVGTVTAYWTKITPVITGSFSAGIIAGDTNTGGLVGNFNRAYVADPNKGLVNNCFYNSEKNTELSLIGKNDTVPVLTNSDGLLDADFYTKSIYQDAGWDFADYWGIFDSFTLPYLKAEGEAVLIIPCTVIVDYSYGLPGNIPYDIDWSQVASSNQDLISGALEIDTPQPAAGGIYNITAGTLSSDTYKLFFVEGIKYVVKSIQNPLFITGPAAAVFGDPDFELNLTGGSGTGTVNYIVLSGPAAIVNGKIRITGAGNIVVKAFKAEDENYSRAESAEFMISAAKAVNGQTPEKPEAERINKDSILLKTVLNTEYSMDSGANWQDSPEFTGLKPDTKYKFILRYKESANFYAGSVSGETVITTNKPSALLLWILTACGMVIAIAAVCFVIRISFKNSF